MTVVLKESGPHGAHDIEAWGRFVVLAVAGITTGLLAYGLLGRRIDPWWT